MVSLCPFVDKDGLIRVGGRLRHATISEEQNYPVILSGKYYVTGLIMRENHQKLLHAPSEQLLYHVRQTYWPLNGRRPLAQRAVKSCLQCFRYKPTVPNTVMGDLPKERVSVASPLS